MKHLLKTIITLGIIVSVYDTPSDPTKVRVEGCLEGTKRCVSVLVKKSDLDNEKLAPQLADFFIQKLLN